MAARRVLIALLAFIGGISIVAALVPVEAPTGEEESSTSTTSAKPDRRAASPRPEPDGTLIRETVRPRASGEPPKIEAELGDQLSLLVYTRAGEQIEITRTGVSQFADRLAPARFDVRLDQTGIYLVKPLAGGEPLATIRVSDPEQPGSRDGGAGARGDGSGSPQEQQPDPMAPELEPS